MPAPFLGANSRPILCWEKCHYPDKVLFMCLIESSILFWGIWGLVFFQNCQPFRQWLATVEYICSVGVWSQLMPWWSAFYLVCSLDRVLIQDPVALATLEVMVENRLLHFPISSVSWVFGLTKKNVKCAAMMETAWSSSETQIRTTPVTLQPQCWEMKPVCRRDTSPDRLILALFMQQRCGEAAGFPKRKKE